MYTLEKSALYIKQHVIESATKRQHGSPANSVGGEMAKLIILNALNAQVTTRYSQRQFHPLWPRTSALTWWWPH